MNRLIAICGLDCGKCDAYIATKNDDQALREETARKWSELNNATILPEHINCEGCRADGKKTVFCDRLCAIRQCALKKAMETCGDCSQMEQCSVLKAVTTHNPDALKNLMELKRRVMETGRLVLRPWRESDAEALYRHASDPDVGPRAGWPPHTSVAESQEIIRKFFLNDHTWAIELKETGQVIGCVGYLPASSSNMQIADDECEVGYWIARPFWDMGICTEALQAVVGYCLDKKGFTTLWGSYFPSNPASGRVMEKCGFSDTGQETLCPNLEVGSDRPVRVMKLEKRQQNE